MTPFVVTASESNIPQRAYICFQIQINLVESFTQLPVNPKYVNIGIVVNLDDLNVSHERCTSANCV